MRIGVKLCSSCDSVRRGGTRVISDRFDAVGTRGNGLAGDSDATARLIWEHYLESIPDRYTADAEGDVEKYSALCDLYTDGITVSFANRYLNDKLGTVVNTSDESAVLNELRRLVFSYITTELEKWGVWKRTELAAKLVGQPRSTDSSEKRLGEIVLKLDIMTFAPIDIKRIQTLASRHFHHEASDIINEMIKSAPRPVQQNSESDSVPMDVSDSQSYESPLLVRPAPPKSPASRSGETTRMTPLPPRHETAVVKRDVFHDAFAGARMMKTSSDVPPGLDAASLALARKIFEEDAVARREIITKNPAWRPFVDKFFQSADLFWNYKHFYSWSGLESVYRVIKAHEGESIMVLGESYTVAYDQRVEEYVFPDLMRYIVNALKEIVTGLAAHAIGIFTTSERGYYIQGARDLHLILADRIYRKIHSEHDGEINVADMTRAAVSGFELPISAYNKLSQLVADRVEKTRTTRTFIDVMEILLSQEGGIQEKFFARLRDAFKYSGPLPNARPGAEDELGVSALTVPDETVRIIREVAFDKTSPIRFVEIPFTIMWAGKTAARPVETHSNGLLYDKKDGSLVRFEPWGSAVYKTPMDTKRMDALLQTEFADRLGTAPILNNIVQTYRSPVEYYTGPSSEVLKTSFPELQDETGRKLSITGFYSAYTVLFTHIRMHFSDKSFDEVMRMVTDLGPRNIAMAIRWYMGFMAQNIGDK